MLLMARDWNLTQTSLRQQENWTVSWEVWGLNDILGAFFVPLVLWGCIFRQPLLTWWLKGAVAVIILYLHGSKPKRKELLSHRTPIPKFQEGLIGLSYVLSGSKLCLEEGVLELNTVAERSRWCWADKNIGYIYIKLKDKGLHSSTLGKMVA